MGGLECLARHYRNPAAHAEVMHASRDSPLTARRLANYDVVVVVPAYLSHRAAARALALMRRTHEAAVVVMADGPGVGAVSRAISGALTALAA
jgi:hypothetical protein